MMRRLFIVVLAAVVLSAPVWAQDGLRGVLSRASYTQPLQPTIAGADLDGDSLPDAAVLIDNGRTLLPGSTRVIELHFTGRHNARLTFQSQEMFLAITALDVNHDGAPDIVVERAFTRQRVQVWLNDGHGGFRRVDARSFPAATSPTPVHLDGGAPRRAPLAALLSGGRAQLALPAGRASPRPARSTGRRFAANGFFPDSRVIASTSSRAPPRAL